MQTLNIKNDSHWLSKVFRVAIPAAIIYGGIKVFNMFAPTLIAFFTNMYYLLILGVPLAFLFIYIISNPMLIWMGYKSICDKITGFIIRQDPLSFMERYIDILQEKLKNLRKSKVFLEGKKIELTRKCEVLSENVTHYLKLAAAAREVNPNLAEHNAYLANSDKETFDTYKPILQRMEINLNFLDKLDENWGLSIEKLQHDVARKKEEYIELRDTAKALGEASQFVRGETEDSKIYQQSVIALEQKVTQKIAFIEDFEKKSKMTMDNMAIEKNMMASDGMKLLDAYMNNDTLLLPNTGWADANVISSKSKQTTNYGVAPGKSNLLNLD